jgi:hypothetical protein
MQRDFYAIESTGVWEFILLSKSANGRKQLEINGNKEKMLFEPRGQ